MAGNYTAEAYFIPRVPHSYDFASHTLADPGVASKLTAQTLDPMYLTPAQFEQRLRSDYDKYAKVVKISGARID